MLMFKMRPKKNHTNNLLFLAVLAILVASAWSWADSDRILLDDVKVLTLTHGRLTTSRRTSPVQQLHCVGGTAGCDKFKPQVVQCTNKGSDGFTVQWECKADMDNAYRFGRIEVVCEGYDHPGDRYVLRGSCGLEYTLDLTKEGMNSRNSHNNGYNYYGQDGGSTYAGNHYSKSSFGMGDIIVLVVIVILIYAIYKTCIETRQYSTTSDDYPSYPGGQGGDYRPTAPPPPGFRPEYQPDSGASCGAGQGYRGSTGGSSGGGFWTGAATGGLLGYMFGNRNTGYNTGYSRPTYGSGWGSGWGNGGGGGSGFGGFSSGSGGSSGGSTGTRTASGFGGSRTR